MIAFMLNDSDVLNALRKRIEQNGLRPTAREIGYSAPFVSDVANGRRGLTEDMGNRLGFVIYEDPPKPPRVWGYAATDAATTQWEHDNYPQKAKP